MAKKLSLVEGLESSYRPKDAIDFYWGLRMLAYAWARAGNFEVESSHTKEKKVKFFPLEVGLNYADRSLRAAQRAVLRGENELEWLTRKDAATRNLWVSPLSRRHN